MIRIAFFTLSLLLASAAQAEILVVASPSLNLKHVSAADVRQIFSGRKNAINGQEVNPVDLPANSEVRARFYEKVLGMSGAQLRAHWVRLIFTGKARPPEMLSGVGELRARLTTSGSQLIGYMKASQYTGRLDVVHRVQ